MAFFILFVIGAVIIGSGAMLAPVWSTAQPRIGTASSFALALVVGGAVFWAHLFGWSTLVMDYMLFGLVSIVILGGTMAQAHQRAQSKDEMVDDKDIGWTGPEDLTFFALVAILFALPLALWKFPFGDYAAANGLLTLAVRDGNSFAALAPYYPDALAIFPPGFHALAAYLSAQLNQPIPQIHMAIGAVCGLLSVWTMYDFGAEIQDKRLGRTMALALLAGFGVLNLHLNGFYPQLMALVFAIAFATYTVRVVRHHKLLDVIAAGLMLGAVIIVSPTMAVAIFSGYIIFLLVNLLPKRIEKGIPREQANALNNLSRWMVVPLIAILAVLPWLVQFISTLQTMLADEGGAWWGIGDFPYPPREALFSIADLWMLPLIVIGILAGWRKYRTLVLWSIGCIAVSHGIYWLPQEWGYLFWLQMGDTAHRMALTPYIPYALLGGLGVLWLYEHFPKWTRDMLRQTVYLQAVLALFALVGLFFVWDAWYANSLETFYNTEDDYAAMQWLMDNAPDATVLNHPTDKWFMATTGIDSVFAVMPARIRALEGRYGMDGISPIVFWQSHSLNTLEIFGIDYIYLPQWASYPIASREYLMTRFVGGESQLANLPYLEVAFEQNGAIVYRVLHNE
jgi:hypothetical protein